MNEIDIGKIKYNNNENYVIINNLIFAALSKR